MVSDVAFLMDWGRAFHSLGAEVEKWRSGEVEKWIVHHEWPKLALRWYLLLFFRTQMSLDNIRDSFLLKNSQLLQSILQQATQTSLGIYHMYFEVYHLWRSNEE